MALEYTSKSRVAVPENTIRPSWDAYSGKNFTGFNLGTIFGPKPLGITTLDGKAYEDTKYNFTKKECTGNTKLAQKVCNNFFMKGNYSSGRVPLGAWAEIHDGSCGDSGFVLNDIVYGKGDWSNQTIFPRKLPDEIATDCSGGSALGQDEYPTKPFSTQFTSNNSAQTDKCFIGSTDAYRENHENCLIGGVQYPVFCQMGDYAGTVNACKEQCNNSESTDNQNNYCNWSLDRLCGKQIGDPIKKNALNETLASDKNWIKEDVCRSYCGPAGAKSGDMSALCKTHKRNYCINTENWPSASTYCYDYWKNNRNTMDINQACNSKLLNAASPENITTNVGCGYLCRGEGLDVDPEYCTSKRQEFCTSDIANMETNYCFNFCKDNPDLCESYLDQYCKDKQDRLDEFVGTQGKKYSDYCGCMLGTQFYEDYKNSVFDQFKQGGYTIEGIANIRSEPECIYPKCKSGSILTSDQRANIKNCGTSCVQVMLNNFEDSTVTGDFLASQSARCINIQKDTEVEDITVDNPDDIFVDDEEDPNEEIPVITEEVVTLEPPTETPTEQTPETTSEPAVTTEEEKSEKQLNDEKIVNIVVGIFVPLTIFVIAVVLYFSFTSSTSKKKK